MDDTDYLRSQLGKVDTSEGVNIRVTGAGSTATKWLYLPPEVYYRLVTVLTSRELSNTDREELFAAWLVMKPAIEEYHSGNGYFESKPITDAYNRMGELVKQ